MFAAQFTQDPLQEAVPDVSTIVTTSAHRLFSHFGRTRVWGNLHACMHACMHGKATVIDLCGDGVGTDEQTQR